MLHILQTKLSTLGDDDSVSGLLRDPTVQRVLGELRSPVFVFCSTRECAYLNTAATQIVEAARPSTTNEDVKQILTCEQQLAGEVFQALGPHSDALFETTCCGPPFLCHGLALRHENGQLIGALVICHDITRIHEAANQRVAAEQELTRALVKEVHHRIKNHLQATVGLLRQHIVEQPSSAEPLQKAVSQLLSIAAVHGIHARLKEDRIYLCSVVEEVVRVSRRITRATIHSPGGLRMFALGGDYAVQIALIVNELATNAVKYTAQTEDARIVISIEPDGENACLTVFNAPARLPQNFDLNAGTGLNAGLRLVRSLLPHRHATLTIREEGAGVAAHLRLLAPVVERNPTPDAPKLGNQTSAGGFE
jgi:two-component sensor histidine kinase